MPDHLPEENSPQSISPVPEKRNYFPNISRFFPEKTQISQKSLNRLAIGLLLLVTAGLSLTAFYQYSLLVKNRQHLKSLVTERTNIEKEINYLEKIAGDYNNYPDIYLKIAELKYRLGEKEIAENYLAKALVQNPNVEQGKVLGAHISR